MKRVPADEFAEHAAEYLKSDESLEIEQDGRVLGRYVPTPHAVNGVTPQLKKDRIRPEARETVERLDRILQQIYDETGMTEEEFARYFDITKPFPYDAETPSAAEKG